MSSRSTGYTAGQIECRASGPSAASTVSPDPVSIATDAPGSDMSSTGTTISMSSSLRTPASTTDTGRGRHSPVAVSRARPPRKRAISSRGRWVADRPMRWGGVGVRRSSRSSERARWLPRFEPATAWISSTMTCSTERRISRAAEVRMR